MMSAPARVAPTDTDRDTAAPGAALRPRDFLALTKPRITALVVLTTVAGYWEGHQGAIDPLRLLQTLLGTGLVAAAASTLNQLVERRADAQMRRTARRPLPAGRLSSRDALAFGVVLLLTGTLWLALGVSLLAAGLALATAASYLLAYTPLKKITSLATVVGAVPGAIPPMIGWAAARGDLGAGAWVLFLIVFFWQMPHFLAIAALYRQDYAAAGFQMLPVVDPGGASTGRQAVLYALALIPVSLLPVFIGMGGPGYFVGALVMGIWFLIGAIRLMARPDDMKRARSLFRLSLLYLPVVLLLLAF